MKKLLLIFCLTLWAYLSASAQNTACSQNYQLACDEEKRLTQQIKDLQCRLDAVHRDKETFIACATAEQNKADLTKIKTVLIQTLQEVEKLQTQPVQLPKPCTTGNCN